jgi:hypothetical protein
LAICRAASRASALVEHAQQRCRAGRAALLAAEEQVRRDVERRRHGEVLVDRLDARRRASSGDGSARLAVEQDLALVRDGWRPTAP